MKKKNIIIGPSFPLRGGIANFNTALCRSFNKESSTSSEIVSFSLQYPGFLFPGTTQFEKGTPPTDFKVHILINSVNPVTWFKTAWFIKSLNPDYVIIRYWLPFMGPCLGTIARILKRSKHIKVIGLMDNVIPHEKRIGDFLFTQYFVKACDGFVVMAESSIKDLKKFTTNRFVKYMPHPLYDIFGEKISKDLALSNLKLDSKFKYILFFGIIRRYKGLDLLLKALTKSCARSQGIKLIIAGEYYEDRSYYDAIIKEEGISDLIVDRSGFVAHEDVKNYFCAVDLSAQTYHHATQSGVSQIAYHFELPMIVTNVGGLAETVPNGKVGYVVDTDPEAIAQAIDAYFCENKEILFRENMGEEKKKFEWKFFIEEIEGLVEELG